MYQMSKINQVKIIKSPNKGLLSSTNTLSNSFNDNPIKYINSLRGFGAQVARALLDLRNLGVVHPSCETIAKKSNCAIRTVERWTARFSADGWLNKSQPDIYMTNVYSFNISKSASHILRIQKPRKFEDCFEVDIESVGHSYSSLELESLFSKKPISESVEDRISLKKRDDMRTFADIIGKGELKSPNLDNLRRILYRLKKEKREMDLGRLSWTQAERDRYLLAKFNALVETPSYIESCKMLKADRGSTEWVKIAIYPESARLDAIEACKEVIEGRSGRKQAVQSAEGCYFSAANMYCTSNNIDMKPSWRNFYQLCKLLGVDPSSRGKKPTPLHAKLKPRNDLWIDGKSAQERKALESAIQGLSALSDSSKPIPIDTHKNENPKEVLVLISKESMIAKKEYEIAAFEASYPTESKKWFFSEELYQKILGKLRKDLEALTNPPIAPAPLISGQHTDSLALA